ncbi:hypothetical protein C7M84_019538 [Penaeus vannamei]|uniref:Uncharacterized protein n=1 Tax=Penaeus vannamei TaxID=6689 RepID=A0A423UBD8_PENVA|nr:hypothetical protein C7M84_019538 [Penaeus vannamei]
MHFFLLLLHPPWTLFFLTLRDLSNVFSTLVLYEADDAPPAEVVRDLVETLPHFLSHYFFLPFHIIFFPLPFPHFPSFSLTPPSTPSFRRLRTLPHFLSHYLSSSLPSFSTLFSLTPSTPSFFHLIFSHIIIFFSHFTLSFPPPLSSFPLFLPHSFFHALLHPPQDPPSFSPTLSFSLSSLLILPHSFFHPRTLPHFPSHFFLSFHIIFFPLPFPHFPSFSLTPSPSTPSLRHLRTPPSFSFTLSFSLSPFFIFLFLPHSFHALLHPPHFLSHYFFSSISHYLSPLSPSLISPLSPSLLLPRLPSGTSGLPLIFFHIIFLPLPFLHFSLSPSLPPSSTSFSLTLFFFLPFHIIFFPLPFPHFPSFSLTPSPSTPSLRHLRTPPHFLSHYLSPLSPFLISPLSPSLLLLPRPPSSTSFSLTLFFFSHFTLSFSLSPFLISPLSPSLLLPRPPSSTPRPSLIFSHIIFLTLLFAHSPSLFLPPQDSPSFSLTIFFSPISHYLSPLSPFLISPLSPSLLLPRLPSCTSGPPLIFFHIIFLPSPLSSFPLFLPHSFHALLHPPNFLSHYFFSPISHYLFPSPLSSFPLFLPHSFSFHALLQASQNQYDPISPRA